MSKRIFRIEAGRYGGECVIGKVDKEFVEAMLEEDQDELIDVITSAEDEDFKGLLPKEDYYMWECDDIEHINAAYADSGFFITEVSNEESKYDYSETETPLEAVMCLYGREAYSMGTVPDDEDIKDDDNYVPTLAFHSGEKGGFGCWFVETDGEDFDEFKLAYGVVETNLAEFIDAVYYDKEELDADYDYNDTTGKSYDADIGWLNKKWRDPAEAYTKIDQEYWDEYNDNVEYEKENR